jgi:hypothetical protein
VSKQLEVLYLSTIRYNAKVQRECAQGLPAWYRLGHAGGCCRGYGCTRCRRCCPLGTYSLLHASVRSTV